ncbi:TAG-18 protein [Aphelenchoides avenae]|nr:TAG-18 protein [Aphelenchus avenae]
MGDFPVVRAKSVACLPRARDIEREASGVATLSRVTSVPNIDNFHVSSSSRGPTLYKYRRDYNLLDDYFHDNYYHNPPLYFADHRYQARRFERTDAPTRTGWYYPSFWNRYGWTPDFLKPQYWRNHRDGNYDRPLWDTWRPYMMDRHTQKRAINMYRQGLLSFNFLDKNWIEPFALARKEKDWGDVYTPAARYGPRRYFYEF